MKKVVRWKAEMPVEAEMLPKDKYTVFNRTVKRYRKGIHSEFFCVLLGWDGIWCRSGQWSVDMKEEGRTDLKGV
jgi:hypothetical protein